MSKLVGKLIIKGEMSVKTGLAIGGSKSGIEIGALDNPVIKTNRGIPYIPGSSLKGKLRTLLARAAGSKNVKEDVKLSENKENKFRHIVSLFGFGANDGEGSGEALLKVSDAFLKESENAEVREKNYTEEKMENSINRLTGAANPRPIERVNPDTLFEIELCLDVYENQETQEQLNLLKLAFQLLEADYLGGGGSRGNGRVSFNHFSTKYLKIDVGNYQLTEEEEDIFTFEYKPDEN